MIRTRHNWIPTLLLALLAMAPAGAQVETVDELTYPALPDFEVPEPRRVELDNGMVVMLLEDHELPLIDVVARVRTGSRLEPADKVGLASLTGAVLRTGGTTSMTGEAYKALLEHTLLSRTAQPDAPWSEPDFRRGIEQSGRRGGLLHHLFTARSRHLAEELTPEALPSYLSGLLIGHEVDAMAALLDGEPEEILLVCAAELRRPYEVATRIRDLPTRWLDAARATRVGVVRVVRTHALRAR